MWKGIVGNVGNTATEEEVDKTNVKAAIINIFTLAMDLMTTCNVKGLLIDSQLCSSTFLRLLTGIRLVLQRAIFCFDSSASCFQLQQINPLFTVHLPSTNLQTDTVSD